MADVSELIANEANDAFTREYRPILDCLMQAQETGDIAPDRDLNQIIELLRNSWLGALVIMKAQKSEEPLLNFERALDTVILQ